MLSPISPEALLQHIRALSVTIGPRPAGHRAEAQARDYIRTTLAASHISTEELPFLTWDTWGYTLAVPGFLAALATLIGRKTLLRRSLGTAIAAITTYHLWQTIRTQKQPLAPLFPKRPSATLLARLPAQQQPRHCVVLIGHTDTNKNRTTFSPSAKQWLRASVTGNLGVHAVTTLTMLAQTLNPSMRGEWLQTSCGLALGALLPVILADEQGAYNSGAQDNASAVACLLGLAAYLHAHPLAYTEVWFAFTGSEEPNALGMHILLDHYGEQLRDAYFIDFELVGAAQIAYVTRHSSTSYLAPYQPDAESLALARATQRRHPHLGVQGHSMIINDEVACLRRRGFRGICLVGVGGDGWLPHWHQPTDTIDYLDPQGVATAAQFALAMIQELNQNQY